MKDKLLFLVMSVVFLAAGCIESESNITGTIQGSSFDVVSGSAENIDDQFLVTLANTGEFSCDTTQLPPDNYLTIVISDITTTGPIDAAGTVFFNTFEDKVGEGEPAERGTVVIDVIQGDRIEGSIDASGPNSSVSGEFSVPVCQ